MTTDADDLVDALVQSAFTTIAVLGRVAADNDLSLTQGRVLGILRDRRLRMSELADHLGLERSTLSGLVDRAAARGLLARVPNAADGRVIEVELTAHGAEFTDRMYRVVADALSPLTRSLTASEQGRLARLLQRMLAGGDQLQSQASSTGR